MFAYCQNNPANYSDPSGNSSISYRKASDEFLSGTFNFIGLGGGGAAGIGSLIVTLEVIEFGVNMASRGEAYAASKVGKNLSNEDYTVYLLYEQGDTTKTVIYVGRVKTENLSARMSYHHSRNRELKTSISGLDYATCRVLEQAGMVFYHTINRANSINNQIRGFSPRNSNRHLYLERVFEIVAKGSYQWGEILPLSYWDNFSENEFLNMGI